MSRAGPGRAVQADAAPLTVAYVPRAQLESALAPGRVLAAIDYGDGLTPLDEAPFPRLHVAMAQLAEPARVEVWTSPEPVEYRRHGPLHYALNREVLVGCLAQNVDPGGFEQNVRENYRAIFELLEHERYPHLLRVWNYFPGIGEPVGELDRYQCFCRGRYESFERAFDRADGRIEEFLPSASAVGTRGGEFVLYFIAARTPGRHRENPRQTSAYRYPPQYGPRSPSFARATLKHWGGAPYLYVSGTASIVGHESRHADDAAVQLDETLRNLEALIGSTAREESCRFRGLESITHFKAYVRRREDVGMVRARLGAVFSPRAEGIYLQGEICRQDLLLEIEAIARG